jgi:hypothetical protein
MRLGAAAVEADWQVRAVSRRELLASRARACAPYLPVITTLPRLPGIAPDCA